MKRSFGILPDGRETFVYTISCGKITAEVSDYGANLVSLWVPDKDGNMADVVLGYDDCNGYRTGGAFLGATVGRNANRIRGASFVMEDVRVRLTPNEEHNNLHSGPNVFHTRLWKAERVSDKSVTLYLLSPQGDQGFPGKAHIRVTYTVEAPMALRVTYDAVADRDTVFNMTNHSYFNLAGHDRTDKAMDQELILPARVFNPDDVENIPTGEVRRVEGTPMDFRKPKAIGRDIEAAYEPLHFQAGYDHNYEVFTDPCAILADPESGRSLAISTDCPGIQIYAGNFLDEQGKGGVHYGFRSGVALETQFCPDAVHHPEWPQPFVKAGQKYHSETVYRFAVQK